MEEITYGPQSIAYTNEDGSVYREALHWRFGDKKTYFQMVNAGPAESPCLMLLARHHPNGVKPQTSWVSDPTIPKPPIPDLELCFASEESLDAVIEALTELKTYYAKLATRT